MKPKEILLLFVELAVLSVLTGCAAKAYPVGTPNPLDGPGETPATAAELHRGNLSEITHNPGYF